MATKGRSTQQRRAGRRAGYVIAVLVNAVIWFVLNVAPGWQSIGFLSSEFGDVLWLVNLSLIVSVVANLVYLFFDPAWFHAAAQIVVNLVGLIVSWRLLLEFPFDATEGWTALIKTLLILAMVGSAIGALVEVFRLVRAVGVGAHS